MDVTLPDGTIIQGVPDGMSKADLTAKLASNGYDVSKLGVVKEDSFPQMLGRGVLNAGAGALRGAGSIGATLLTPYDYLAGNTQSIGNPERRKAMDDALQSLGADPKSIAFQGGKLGAEIAGTLPIGGMLAKPISAVAPRLGQAIATGGITTGADVLPTFGAKTLDMGTRMLGGAANAGITAGSIDPSTAITGAEIGAFLPPGLKALGATGNALGRVGRAAIGNVSPESAALATRAKELGIDIPADRLVNSKPMDAVASALNYLPFSGRAATESRMGEQLNRAASRTMGQDTPNINQAIRKASDILGGKFDTTLKAHSVLLDKTLLEDATAVVNKARDELGDDAFRAIESKFNHILEKGKTGVIDGQAAYVIKRDLDRIGRGNSPNAWHALELKGKLMEALDRSLGEEAAKAFAKTRQQYGNMLALEKLAKNGVEGEISVARLANLKNINNKPLQEIADIAAQFVKPREGQHGAMQRAVVGLTTASMGGPAGLLGMGVVGRGANSLLNSGLLTNRVLGNTGPLDNLLANPDAQGLLYRGAPYLAEVQ